MVRAPHHRPDNTTVDSRNLETWIVQWRVWWGSELCNMMEISSGTLCLLTQCCSAAVCTPQLGHCLQWAVELATTLRKVWSFTITKKALFSLFNLKKAPEGRDCNFKLREGWLAALVIVSSWAELTAENVWRMFHHWNANLDILPIYTTSSKYWSLLPAANTNLGCRNHGMDTDSRTC